MKPVFNISIIRPSIVSSSILIALTFAFYSFSSPSFALQLLGPAASNESSSSVTPSSTETTNNISVPGMSTAQQMRFEGPTKPTDTLWSIAQSYLPSDSKATVYQVIGAIHKLNPRAFVNGNLHGLIPGSYLAMPTLEQILQQSTGRVVRQLTRDESKIEAKEAARKHNASKQPLSQSSPVKKSAPPSSPVLVNPIAVKPPVDSGTEKPDKAVSVKQTDLTVGSSTITPTLTNQASLPVTASDPQLNEKNALLSLSEENTLENATSISNNKLDIIKLQTQLDSSQSEVGLLNESNQVLRRRLEEVKQELVSLKQQMAADDLVTKEMQNFLSLQKQKEEQKEEQEKVVEEKEENQTVWEKLIDSSWLLAASAILPSLFIIGGVGWYVIRQRREEMASSDLDSMSDTDLDEVSLINLSDDKDDQQTVIEEEDVDVTDKDALKALLDDEISLDEDIPISKVNDEKKVTSPASFVDEDKDKENDTSANMNAGIPELDLSNSTSQNSGQVTGGLSEGITSLEESLDQSDLTTQSSPIDNMDATDIQKDLSPDADENVSMMDKVFDDSTLEEKVFDDNSAEEKVLDDNSLEDKVFDDTSLIAETSTTDETDLNANQDKATTENMDLSNPSPLPIDVASIPEYDENQAKIDAMSADNGENKKSVERAENDNYVVGLDADEVINLEQMSSFDENDALQAVLEENATSDPVAPNDQEKKEQYQFSGLDMDSLLSDEPTDIPIPEEEKTIWQTPAVAAPTLAKEDWSKGIDEYDVSLDTNKIDQLPDTEGGPRLDLSSVEPKDDAANVASLLVNNHGITQQNIGDDNPISSLSMDDERLSEEDIILQLDLAKAYIEMNDKEGAMHLLEKVMRLPNEKYQQQAKLLLETIK